MHGTAQIAKSPAMPPPIWKKPTDGCFPAPWFCSYHSMSVWNCSVPLFTHVWCAISPLMTLAAKMLPVVESSHPGEKTGMPAFLAASIQELVGSIW